MDETSISIEMEVQEVVEAYKLEKELIPSIVNLVKEINKPTPTKAQDIDGLKQDLKNLFKEEIKNEDEDEYNIYLH